MAQKDHRNALPGRVMCPGRRSVAKDHLKVPAWPGNVSRQEVSGTKDHRNEYLPGRVMCPGRRPVAKDQRPLRGPYLAG